MNGRVQAQQAYKQRLAVKVLTQRNVLLASAFWSADSTERHHHLYGVRFRWVSLIVTRAVCTSPISSSASECTAIMASWCLSNDAMILVHHVSHMVCPAIWPNSVMPSHTDSRQTLYVCDTTLGHVTILNTAHWDKPTPLPPQILKQISISSFHLLFWFSHSSFPVNCPLIATQQLLIANQALTNQFSMSLNTTFSEYMSMSLTNQLSRQ